MRKLALLLAMLIVAALAACGEEGTDVREGTGDAQPGEQPPPTEGVTTVEEFTLEDTGGMEDEIEPAAGSAGRGYADEVEQISADAQRDFSGISDASARVEGGNLVLSVEDRDIERARDAAQENLERLENLDPPAELADEQEALADAYRDVLPAYDNLLEAMDSNDPARIAEAANRDLPEIQQSIGEIQTRSDDLREAAEQQARQSGGE